MIATVTNQGKARWMIFDEAFDADKLIEFLQASCAFRVAAPRFGFSRFLFPVAFDTENRRKFRLYWALSIAGNRKVEFLPLTWPQIDRKAGVIRTICAKQRGKKRQQIVKVIAIGPDLAALLCRLEAIRPDRDCLYVFPTRDNNQYTDRGFKTL